jgi:hypothetical protein
MSRISAADAIRLLQEAGHVAGQRRAPAGSCRTLCYVVNGQRVNLGRLREMAEALPRTLDLTTGRYEIRQPAA